MRLRARRWNDPGEPGDGLRVLVTRYRPRGVAKRDETWDEWLPDAGPSRELHADFFGKHGPPIGWAEYKRRYLAEIRARPEVLARLRALADRGPLTLLCSSHCVDPKRCHRTLLARLVEKRNKPGPRA